MPRAEDDYFCSGQVLIEILKEDLNIVGYLLCGTFQMPLHPKNIKLWYHSDSDLSVVLDLYLHNSLQ